MTSSTQLEMSIVSPYFTGLGNPVDASVVIPLYWVTWLSALCWGTAFVVVTGLVSRFREAP